jgi:hypothetical protein
MPFSFEVDKDARVAYVRSWGSFEAEGNLRAPLELARDPGYEPDFGVVFDLRDLLHEPRSQDIVEMTRNFLSLREHYRHRVGVVVSKRLALSAELAAAIAGAGGVPIQIFAELDEAFAWVRPRGRVG